MKNLYSVGLGLLLTGLSLSSIADPGRMMSVNKNSPTSYFEVTVKDDGLLNGTYKGWCGDWATPIGHDELYETKFYSSTSPTLPPGLVDHPENLDEVNWILNQHFVGKTAPGDLGAYTTGDVQLAMWTLLDEGFDASTVGPYSQARVDLIVSMAREHDGYIPKCKGVIGIILDPVDQQTVIFEIKVKHFPKCSVPDGDSSLE